VIHGKIFVAARFTTMIASVSAVTRTHSDHLVVFAKRTSVRAEKTVFKLAQSRHVGTGDASYAHTGLATGEISRSDVAAIVAATSSRKVRIIASNFPVKWAKLLSGTS
jgi:hypothetical protein